MSQSTFGVNVMSFSPWGSTWDTECYKMRSSPHTPPIWRAACILLSALIVIKPVLPVALSVTWMPNWFSAVQMNCTSHGLEYFSGDTES